MKKLTLLLLFMTSVNVFAEYSELHSATCRQASIEYKRLPVALDATYLGLLKAGGITPKDSQIINQIREKFKDKEYKRLIERADNLISQGTSRLDADTWRTLMEASIDIAEDIPTKAAAEIFTIIVEKPRSTIDFSGLGKSEDYYQRKIYDACISGRENY